MTIEQLEKLMSRKARLCLWLSNQLQDVVTFLWRHNKSCQWLYAGNRAPLRVLYLRLMRVWGPELEWLVEKQALLELAEQAEKLNLLKPL